MTEPSSSPDTGPESTPERAPDAGVAADVATTRAGPWDEPARALRLSRDRWVEVAGESWSPALLMLFGAWLLIAWNRLGLQGFSAPRIGIRFLLVGFYGWVGMVLVLLVAARLTGMAERPDPATLAKSVARAHQPMVIVGFLVQVTQALPIQLLSTVSVIVAMALWMPGQIVVGSATAFGVTMRRMAGPAMVAYGLWLLTVGRYLLGQLGHLF